MKLTKIFCVLIAIFALMGCDRNHTHMKQYASGHVTLASVRGMTGGCGPGLREFRRVLPDGKGESGGWRVPEGKVLVVTDVDWQYAHPDHETAAGTIQVLRLFLENLAEPPLSKRVFESTITLNRQGQGGISEAMTSGFVVSSEARICHNVFPGPQGPPFGISHVILRGYLVQDK